MRTNLLPRLTLAAALAITASEAVAQQPAAPAPAPAPLARPAPQADTRVAEVVVTAERPAVVTSIDRKSYNVARDLNAANGSISDVLRNLPSVDVDVEGNVSVRGESSVQILVDGKPSTLYSGSNRAQALQQLPANTVETIEVMTNPSAEFSPDGTGGIINIVLKKVRKPGKSGSLQAGAGSFGRWNASALGAYNNGPLSVTANVGARRYAGARAYTEGSTRIDSILNQRTDVATSGRSYFAAKSMNGSTGVDYDLTPSDRLSFSGGLNASESHSHRQSTDLRINGAGVTTSDYDQESKGRSENDGAYGSLNWRHTFPEAGRVFTLSARRNGYEGENSFRAAFTNRVPAGSRFEERRSTSSSTGQGLTAAYVLPLGPQSSLKVGYEYGDEENTQDDRGTRIDVNGVRADMANVTNRFVYVQTNHQAYATYQRPFGKFTLLAGARLEQALLEYDQQTTAVTGESDYTDIHPSLHLQYDLTESQKLSASYSHRVQRPYAFQLNPFVSFGNEFSAHTGNPDLRPQETHSWEAGWQWLKGSRNASATVYYRQSYNTIGSVNRFLTPTVLLNTYENQGDSASGGVEFDTGGNAGDKIRYRVGGNIYYNQIQRSSLAGGDKRSAFAYTVKGNLDYKATPKDLFQLTGNYSGKQLNSQGYRLATGSLNLGYQRKFRPYLIGVFTVSDIFESNRYAVTSDTPTVFGWSYSDGGGRTFTIGITRTLGNRPARDVQLEYDTGGGGGAGGGL